MIPNNITIGNPIFWVSVAILVALFIVMVVRRCGRHNYDPV